MKPSSKETLTRFQSLFALVAMVIVLSLMSGSWNGFTEFWRDFLTAENGLNVLRQISINLCLSIGMTLVILSGGIDLSVGSVLAISGAVAAGLLKNGLALAWMGVQLQFTPFGAIIAGIAVGLALGWVNGMTITRLRLPPFIATLGMLSIARGLSMLWTHGHPITDLGRTFEIIGSGMWLKLPVIVWICVALIALFYVVSVHTTLGRYIHAVGGSERAAMFAGLRVEGVKVWVYVLAGGLAGVSGVLLTARLNSATPNAGIGYELDSIAAVVIGGTSLSGGRGSVFGTVMGCLIIGVLNSGLVKLGVSPEWQMVMKGAVIIFAAAIDKVGARNERA